MILISWLLLASRIVFLDNRITLLSPNGGEVIQRGTNFNVKWICQEPNQKLALLLYQKGRFICLIARDLPDNGFYFWKVGTELAAGKGYRLRVRSMLSPDLNDFSDNDFEIK